MYVGILSLYMDIIFKELKEVRDAKISLGKEVSNKGTIWSYYWKESQSIEDPDT